MPSVLVVEDSLTQSTQIRLMLKSAEFEVFVAENGREALGILEKHQPDIVLTDMQMPEMDGLQLGRSHPRPLPAFARRADDPARQRGNRLGRPAARGGQLPAQEANFSSTWSPRSMTFWNPPGRPTGRNGFRSAAFGRKSNTAWKTIRRSLPPCPPRSSRNWRTNASPVPPPARQIGVAFRKALENAIFHGNLELSEDDRQDGELVYRDLAEQRRNRPPWCGRNVWVTLTIDEAQSQFDRPG